MPNLHEIAVSLTAKSAGFDAGINQAIASTKRLEAEIKRLQGTMKLTVPSVTPGTTAIRTTTTASNSLLSSLTGLAAGYFTLNTAIKGVSAAFSASASVERQERAWKGIAGSVAGGRAEIEFVRASADKLGVSFTSLEEGYRKISSSAKGTTLEGQAAKQIFTDIAVTMQALGSSSDDVAGAMHTLGQMISTGVVQADELRNELGNRLPNVMGIAAKSTNMTTQEFRKLQETGSILTADFLPNWAKMMRSTYVPATEAGAKVTLSLEQEAERAKNVLQQLAAIGLKETGVENWLKRLLAGMTEFGKEAVKASERLNAMRAGDAERIKGTIETAAGGVPLSAKASTAAAQELQRLEEQQETTFATMHRLMKRQEQALKAGLAFPQVLEREIAQAEKAWLSAKAQRDAFLKTVPTFERKDAVPMIGEGPSFATEQRALQGKTKSFDADALAIQKEVDAAGLALIRMGKTAREAAEEQLKLLDKKTEELRLKYPDQNFGVTMGAGVGKRAPAEYQLLAAQAGQKWNVDPYLIQAIMAKETTNFDRFATSPAGAQGLMQIMPPTQKRFGVTDPFDPKQSIDAAAQYLNVLGKMFKDQLPLVIAAYNAGEGRVQKAGGIPQNKETPGYVANVTAELTALRKGDPGSMGGGGSLLATQRQGLMDTISSSKADEATIKALAEAEVEANTTIAESMAALLEKLQTGTDDQNAYARSVYASQAATAAAEGDTVALERNLAALDTELDKATVSTTAQERALILERMATVQGYEATKLLAQLRAEDADLIEKQAKTHKDLTIELKAQQEVEETMLRLRQNNAGAIEDIIAQLKAGVSPIRDMVTGMTEFEELFKRLRELGATSDTMKVAEGLRQQSSIEFAAIKDGAANLASEIQSRTIASLSGSKDAWKDFGNFAISELTRILFKAMNFEQNLTALLTSAGSALLKMFGGMAGGSGDPGLGGLGGASGGTGGLDFGAEGGMFGAGQRVMVGEAGRELMMSGGRMRLVGLHGPEVVRTRDNAFVIPHQQTMTLLRGQRQLDNVVHTMARRAIGGSVNAGQTFLAGEAGVEGVVSRGGKRNQGGVNITVNVQGVKDMQSFVQPRSQAEIQRAMAAALRAAQGST